VIPVVREFTYPRTFWSKPGNASNFGLFIVTMFNGSSHMLAMPFLALAPLRLLLADSTSPHGSVYGSPQVRFRQLHTRRLLPLHVPVGFAS
jgi:hypothetical protein